MTGVKRIKNLYIGIAAEGNHDIDVCAWLSRKIAEPLELKTKIRKENRFVNTTKISPGRVAEIKRFFDQKKLKRPKLIVIITDRDGGRKTKAKLDQAVNKIGFKQHVIVVTPVEHIEAWLVEDMLAINKVLKPLRKHRQIGNIAKKNAKTILEGWIGRSISKGRFKGDPSRARIEIAKKIRIRELRRLNEFIEFEAELKRKAREIIQPPKPLKKIKSRKKKRRRKKKGGR